MTPRISYQPLKNQQNTIKNSDLQVKSSGFIREQILRYFALLERFDGRG
jgi:hypothetical protein